jgi:metal-responsive CopG/Arc/MetJ family transcriptional regulator
MKVKTSISIDQSTLDELDGYVGSDNNRSVLIQQAVDSWLAQRRRKARDERDVRIINENAEALNREMAEVLEFQVWE